MEPAGHAGAPPDFQRDGVPEQAEAAIRLAGAAVTADGKRGDPVDILQEVADQVNATMIVVGSQGCTGRGDWRSATSPTRSRIERGCNVLIVSTEQQG